MLGFLAATALLYRAFGATLHFYRRPPSEIWPWLYYACINAPILEEVVYRFILCVPATALARPLGAIVLSGAAFAALHVATGVASPDNLIAGYILAWAYLKSGSLFVPVTLHLLGNSCVLIVEVAAWHWG
jgi:membrane protease YdiL (CAAX protease family)